MEEKLSIDIENRVRLNATIQQIHQLFEQLRQTLTNTDKILSAQLILHDLANICFDLIKRTYKVPADAIDIFEYILKNYLELLDTNQFIDVVTYHYTLANNHFIRSLFICSDNLHRDFSIDQITSQTRQKMYCRLLDQLTSSTRIMSFLKNELTFQSTDNEKVKRTIASSCGSILIIVLRHLTILHGRSIHIELYKYQNTLFTWLITFLDEHFMTNTCSQNDILVKQILVFLLNTSNKTLTIPIFLNVDCPQACLRWLSLSYLSGHEYKYIIRILYNMARHDDGAMILDNPECYKIVHRFRTEIAETMVDFLLDIKMYGELSLNFYMMIFSTFDVCMLDPGVTNIFVTNELISAIMNATDSLEQEYLNFHTSELWFVLMKIFIHDDRIDYVLQNDRYPEFFSVIVREFLYYIEDTEIDNICFDSDILTVMVLMNILWSISFHDRYKNDFIQSTGIITKLKEFRTMGIIDKVLPNIYISRHMSSLRRCTDGIWQNLYPSESQIKFPENKSVCSLMISYAHFDIDYCRQVYDILNKHPRLSISVDFNNGKYLWQEIAQTMEQSDVVLFLISKDFFHSKSCRQELIYATDTLKKAFIPVFINDGYQTTGWLTSRLSGLKSIRLNETDLSSSCDELLLLMNESLSMNIPSLSSVKSSSDGKQWDDKDVQQWFTKNHIIPDLYDFYHFENGNELLLYAQAILAFPWTKEYERIRLRFEEKFQQHERGLSPHEFLKFINALEHLKYQNLSIT